MAGRIYELELCSNTHMDLSDRNNWSCFVRIYDNTGKGKDKRKEIDSMGSDRRMPGLARRLVSRGYIFDEEHDRVATIAVGYVEKEEVFDPAPAIERVEFYNAFKKSSHAVANSLEQEA